MLVGPYVQLLLLAHRLVLVRWSLEWQNLLLQEEKHGGKTNSNEWQRPRDRKPC